MEKFDEIDGKIPIEVATALQRLMKSRKDYYEILKKMGAEMNKRVSHKGKPDTIVGGPFPESIATIIEMEQMRVLNRENWEAIKPKLSNPKVGNIIVFGTGGEIKNDGTAKDLYLSAFKDDAQMKEYEKKMMAFQHKMWFTPYKDWKDGK